DRREPRLHPSPSRRGPGRGRRRRAVKRAMNDESGKPITLERYLGARLLALAALACVVVSLSAPVAFADLRMRELGGQAAATGRSVAELIGREAALRPALWRYDTLKLVEHVAHRQSADVERIEITGNDGRPLGFGAGTELARLESADVLWASAPLL